MGVIAWPGGNKSARPELFTEVAWIQKSHASKGGQNDFSYGSQRECAQGSCSRSAEAGSSVQRNVPIAWGSREGTGWDEDGDCGFRRHVELVERIARSGPSLS